MILSNREQRVASGFDHCDWIGQVDIADVRPPCAVEKLHGVFRGSFVARVRASAPVKRKFLAGDGDPLPNQLVYIALRQGACRAAANHRLDFPTAIDVLVVDRLGGREGGENYCCTNQQAFGQVRLDSLPAAGWLRNGTLSAMRRVTSPRKVTCTYCPLRFCFAVVMLEI